MERQPLVVTTDDGIALVGELVIPAGSAGLPAALLLNGSGPLDRDSNMPGQVLDVANALAAALADEGVGSLRFDKRGVGESEGEYLTAGFERETDDADAALAALRGTRQIDPQRVTVIGHSVGATIAIRLASRHDWVAGVVLLSASAQRGSEVMRLQSERIAATSRWFERPRAKSFLRAQQRVRERILESSADVELIGGQELPSRWLREFMAYDPVDDLAATRCPVLVVTGRKDVQVDPDDVERLGTLVAGSFEGETPADLTHVLRRHRGRPGIDTYAKQLTRAVDAELLERVATWVAARRPNIG
jgi:pimeloyl-ACP methyl ester carboxylesterase